MDSYREFLLDLVEEFEVETPEQLVEIVQVLAGIAGTALVGAGVNYAGRKIGEIKGKADAKRDLKNYMAQQQAARAQKMKELQARRERIVQSMQQMKDQQDSEDNQ